MSILIHRMVKEEGHNLEEAIVKCKDMTETLLSLRKFVHTIIIIVIDNVLHTGWQHLIQTEI